MPSEHRFLRVLAARDREGLATPRGNGGGLRVKGLWYNKTLWMIPLLAKYPPKPIRPQECEALFHRRAKRLVKAS